MNVLLTGSAGFIGFHVGKALLARGDRVVGFDNFNPYYDRSLKERRNELLAAEDGFELVRGDLNDPEALDRAFDLLGEGAGSGGETRVCHLAAQAGVRHSLEHPEKFLRDNVLGFHEVIERCRTRDVGGLIYASTSSVYGDNRDEVLSESSDTDRQASLYGMTKKANELHASVYHRLHGVRSTGLRFFTVYGPWGRPDMALFLFTEAILRGETMKVFGEGKLRRDFTFVDDIVAGVLAALDANLECEIVNLGRGRPEVLMDFIRVIESSCGSEGKKEFLPRPPGDVQQTHADISKARRLFGYEPRTSIAEGVPRFVEWYREYHGL
jgi:UDP-glucuronate 4-epimerase